MPFDAACARAELAAYEERIAALEADGANDEEVLDAICEMNELRDLIRNHENFPPLWHEDWRVAEAGPTSVENYLPEGGCCLALRGLLGSTEAASLLAAVITDPRPEEAGCEDFARTEVAVMSECVSGGFAQQADDVMLSALLWERVYNNLPAEVSAPPRTPTSQDVQLEGHWAPLCVDQRLVFRRISQGIPDLPFQMDTPAGDDREDGRPLLNIIMNLGVGWGSGAEELQVEFLVDEQIREVLLRPGDAVLFSRGDPRCGYRVQGVGVNVDVVSCTCKVMYSFIPVAPPEPGA